MNAFQDNKPSLTMTVPAPMLQSAAENASRVFGLARQKGLQLAFDSQALVDAADERTKTFFVCNPNNPKDTYLVRINPARLSGGRGQRADRGPGRGLF